MKNCANCWQAMGTERERYRKGDMRRCRTTNKLVFVTGAKVACCPKWQERPSVDAIARKANAAAQHRIHPVECDEESK